MPWDNPQPYQPQPQYQPPPQQYQPPPPPPQYAPAQQMRPDVPTQVTARNQATGESVKLDIGSVIQQAVNDALRQNSAAAAQNASKAMQAKAIPRAAMPKGSMELTGDETVEEAFTSGAVTRITFIRGLALDVGVGLVAAFATIASGPNFSAFDKELWTAIIPALLMKTVVQTVMSYVMKAKYTE
jgi:hypothetical protein